MGCTARPAQQGWTQQLGQVEIVDGRGRLTSTGQVRLANVAPPEGAATTGARGLVECRDHPPSPRPAVRRSSGEDLVTRDRHGRTGGRGTADPALIGPWLTDADQERTAAEIELQALDATAGPDMTPEALWALLDDLRSDYGDMAAVLADADPADKAALLSALGVRVEWVPTADRARVSVHYGSSVPGGSCRRSDGAPTRTAAPVRVLTTWVTLDAA